MTATQHTSGNLNDIRAYPLADNASRRDDNDAVLPESIINDCHIWWPDLYGEEAFVASVTVSPSLLTLTIAAKDSSSGEVTVIAAAQIPRPVVNYRSYALTALQAGVGGWLAPGSIPYTSSSEHTWIFSTPAQSRLLARVAQPYASLPVSSLGKRGDTRQLTGDVKFIAGRDLSIEAGYRDIDGVSTRCIVFGLKDDRLPDLYEHYAGPCGKRPESENCPRTTLRTINGVTPDSEGVVYIDIDDTNGVIEGRADITDGTANAAIYTPIEYEDVCEAVEPIDPLPGDLCESSLSAATGSSSSAVFSSSSAAPAAEESSSSSVASSEEYTFLSPSDIFDFVAFNDAKEYERDYDLAQLGYGGENRLMWRNNRIVMHVPDKRRVVARLMNAKKKARLRAVGDWAETEARIAVSRADILAEPYTTVDGHSVDFRIGIGGEGLIDRAESSNYTHRGIRARAQFKRYDYGDYDAVRVDISAEWFGGVFVTTRAWQVITAAAPYYSMLQDVVLHPVACDAALLQSSSSIASVATSSSSSANAQSSSSIAPTTESSSSAIATPPCYLDLPDEIVVNLRLRVEVTEAPVVSNSSSSAFSSGAYKFAVSLHAEIEQEGVDPRLIPGWTNVVDISSELDVTTGYFAVDDDGDWDKLGFFDTNLVRTNNGSSDGPFQTVPVEVERLRVSANYMRDLVCDGIDFEASPARVDYAVEYTPSSGWSTDFSNIRAASQMRTESDYIVPEYPSIGADYAISLPYQYLNAEGGATHKYAILPCQTVVADSYVYSAAFKAVMGRPKYGIVLGYQGGTNDVFWAVMLDVANQQITYGVQYLGIFLAAGWSALPPQPRSWQYDWHRLVVRIVGSGPYVVQAWVDPADSGSGSSSSLNLTKTIPINYSGAQYTLLPIAAWDGNLSGVPQNEFAEGNPGIYVYGGEARIAEFTVSPNGQDIVVPNKVPWLGNL